MKQTIFLKLAPSQEQHQAILNTVRAFHATCAAIAEQAKAAQTASVLALGALDAGAQQTQARLPGPLALRALFLTEERYRQAPDAQPTFPAEGPIPLDEAIASFQGLTHFSLLTLAGRIAVPFIIDRVEPAQEGTTRGQAQLSYQENQWIVAVTLEAVEIVPPS